MLTPMGSGIAAYATPAAAARAQEQHGGDILSYADLAPRREAWVHARMGAPGGRQQ